MDSMGLDMMLLLLKGYIVSGRWMCAAAAGRLRSVCNPKVGHVSICSRGSNSRRSSAPLSCPSSLMHLTACAGCLHHVCS